MRAAARAEPVESIHERGNTESKGKKSRQNELQKTQRDQQGPVSNRNEQSRALTKFDGP
jgi:hypothetical protein